MTASVHARLSAALEGRYRLERELGAGGMATVHLAHDLRHDRRVALKVLHAELARAIGPERFHREIRIAAGLQHPHILPVFDSGEADGLTWYTMPFVEGESLRDLLAREGQLPVEQALALAREVAGALDYAHAQGIVHRDIKPENIMLSHGHALVADFGIARALGDTEGGNLTGTGLAIGTPAYMSPEQAAASGDVDGRTDVYSLGCVLYEMLAGEPPYTGPSPHSIFAKRMTDPIPSPARLRPGVPASLDAAVTRALALAPADRFRSAGDMARALDAPLGPARTSPRGGRALAGAALAVLAAGAAMMLARGAGVPAAEPVPVLSILPFRNLGEPANQYFAEGLTEEVATRLATLSGLSLRRRGAGLATSDTLRTPGEIGRDHGATYVLTGTVRWDRRTDGSSAIRVTPRLVRVRDERELLGESIDADLVNVFEVQSDIATRVSDALGLVLGDAARRRLAARPAERVEAWDRFARGNFHLARRTPDAVRRAIEEYDAAIALEPGFARAIARAAYAHLLFLDWGWPLEGMSGAEVRRVAADLTQRALAADSASADAWLAQAYLRVIEDPFRLEGAVPAFQRVVTLDSTNAEAWHQYGQTLMILGRFDEAVSAYHRVLALEPERPMTLVPLSAIARQQGRLADAQRLADSAVELVGLTTPYARVVRGNLSLAAGDAAGARRDAEVALAADSSYPVPARALLAASQARLGDTASAGRTLLEALATVDPRTPSATDVRFLGFALVSLGRREEALDLIERVRPRGATLWFYLSSPDFAPLRGDPRFDRVYREAAPQAASPGPVQR